MLMMSISAVPIPTPDGIAVNIPSEWLVLLLPGLALVIGIFYRNHHLQRTYRALLIAREADQAEMNELQMHDRDKAELSTIVTHDLLQAIAAVRTYTVALRSQWANLDEDARIEVIGWMDRETGRMRDLAEQAVAVLHPDTEVRAVPTRAVRAAEIVWEAAEAFNELGGRLKVRVEPEAEDALVEVDRTRVEQVFMNLLRNAAKYSEPDAPIELQLQVSGKEVVFSVRDNGHGVAADEIESLFGRFSQSSASREGSVPGLGLGLYISSSIVQTLGGHIWVESHVGEGAQFSFSLPRAKGTA